MVDVKKVAVGVILLVVFVILIFQLVGNSAGDLTSAAESITDANNCSDGTDSTGATFTYNQSSKFCVNSTDDKVYLAGQIDLPLNTLFGSGGILMLIFMAVILIIAVMTVIKGMKDK
jgi:hypothetical protein